MEKWQELFASAKEKYQAVKMLLETDEPDMAQVSALRGEADAEKARAVELKAVSTSIGEIGEPVMPADLPTEPDPEPESGQDNAIKTVYQIRYGDEDSAVKAVLKDLHGPDYEQKRWDVYQRFVKYLRTGQGDNREIIFTPQTVKTALNEGQDVKALKAVMVEGADTLGGYVVPEDLRADMIARMAALTVIRPLARVIQTSRDSVEIPSTTGGGSQYRDAVRVTWIEETPTAGTAATNMTLGLEKIPVHTVMAETFLSRNLVEDAAFNLVDWLSDSFASAQAIDEDNKFLVGDGAGEPQGILPGSTNGLSLTEENSGNASALTFDGLKGLVWAIDAQYRQNARFIGEKATYEAIDKIQTGDGEYLWSNKDNQVQVAGGGLRLLGYPWLEQEAMPTIASDAYPLLFVDLSGYIIVDRVGMSVERYLDSSTARINQVLYVARRRLGGQFCEDWKAVVQKVSA